MPENTTAMSSSSDSSCLGGSLRRSRRQTPPVFSIGHRGVGRLDRAQPCGSFGRISHSPAFKRRAQQWVDVASAGELPAGVPKQLEYVATIQDGYLETKTQKAVWAVKQANGEVTVFSPMCTHLGCGYHWDGAGQQFKCPCHGSVFDISGRVVAGPAPRPLDAFAYKDRERSSPCGVQGVQVGSCETDRTVMGKVSHTSA